jgi:UDP-N-acetylmuramoyl-tripeptide--D-alanyl-D-alanine ligase
VGKTSAKEMLRAALSTQGEVHAAEASYNNHWGVPLTLARLPPAARFAVVEIGMNHPARSPPRAPGPPARGARHHRGAAHLEAFEDVDGIAREKASIVEGLEPGGTAVLTATSPRHPSCWPPRGPRARGS